MHPIIKYYTLAPLTVKVAANPHAKEAPKGCNFEVVGWKSPLAYRKAAEYLAYCFRRELHYDIVQYEANEVDSAESKLAGDRVLMFGQNYYTSEGNGRKLFYGAVCVRWVDGWIKGPSWTLRWAWFHPYQRNRKHLSRAWPAILKT